MDIKNLPDGSVEDTRAVPGCNTGVAGHVTSTGSHDMSRDLSHDWSCDKPPEPLPEAEPNLLPTVSNVREDVQSVVQDVVLSVDGCGRCGTLLSEMIYKRSIRMKCKDGLYR